MYHIKETNEFGRGLYALGYIYQDSIITEAELLVLSELDTVLVDGTDLRFYTFRYNERQDCIVLGDGELFNHSDTPNVAFALVPHYKGTRLVMQFKALRYIEPGEQLFIDYNADIKVDTSQYTKNMIG